MYDHLSIVLFSPLTGCYIVLRELETQGVDNFPKLTSLNFNTEAKWIDWTESSWEQLLVFFATQSLNFPNLRTVDVDAGSISLYDLKALVFPNHPVWSAMKMCLGPERAPKLETFCIAAGWIYSFPEDVDYDLDNDGQGPSMMISMQLEKAMSRNLPSWENDERNVDMWLTLEPEYK